MAWATSVWPAIASVRRTGDRTARSIWCSRSWRSRWRLAVGLGALGGMGATGNPGEGTVSNGLAEFSTVVVGIITFGLAAFMPFLVIKLIPIVEAAVIAQGIHSAPMRAAQTGLQYSYYFNGVSARVAGTGKGIGGADLVAGAGAGGRDRPGSIRRLAQSGGAVSDATSGKPRTYRFSPLVRAGLFGAMPTSQVVVLAVGCGLSFVGILLRLFPWALVPALLAAVIAFKRVGGWALHELIPLKIAWWTAVDAGTGGSGRYRCLTSRRAAGRGDAAGDGQAGAARRRGRVGGHARPARRRRRHSRHRRRSVDRCVASHRRWSVLPDLAGRAGHPSRDVGRRARRILPRATDRLPDRMAGVVDLDDGRGIAAGWRRTERVRSPTQPPTTSSSSRTPRPDRSHTTRCVADGRPCGRPGAADPTGRRACRRAAAADRGAASVHGATRSSRFAGRSTVEPGRADGGGPYPIRHRSPSRNARHSSTRSQPGLGVTATDLAPMAVAEEWECVRVDRSIHRSWWVEGWPRSEVPAVWMDLLLLGGQCTRTVTVVFEPVSPSQSARSVDEASVALESAEAAKSKRRLSGPCQRTTAPRRSGATRARTRRRLRRTRLLRPDHRQLRRRSMSSTTQPPTSNKLRRTPVCNCDRSKVDTVPAGSPVFRSGAPSRSGAHHEALASPLVRARPASPSGDHCQPCVAVPVAHRSRARPHVARTSG